MLGEENKIKEEQEVCHFECSRMKGSNDIGNLKLNQIRKKKKSSMEN